MIFKYEIVEAVNSLGLDLAELAIRVYHLEERVTELEEEKCKCEKKCAKNITKKMEKKVEKRGRGRPRKVSK